MISEAKRRQVEAMISGEYPGKVIAVQVGVSESTVDRISRQMKRKAQEGDEKAPAAVESETEQNLDITDYNTVLTKSEADLTKKIISEIQMFEDKTEGWTFHKTAQELRMQKTGMWWGFIAYPESAPENWVSDLSEQCAVRGFQAAISPIHDKDVWAHDSDAQDINGKHYEKGELYKAGDPKKAHMHGILKTVQKIPYVEAADFIRNITHGPYPIRITSLKGSYEYFTHEGQTDKYHYEKDEIIRINNFVVEPSDWEKKIIACEINDIIIDEQIDNYAVLTDRFRNQVEYQTVIAGRGTHFHAMIDGIYQLEHAEGYEARFAREHWLAEQKRLINKERKAAQEEQDNV